MSDPVLRIVAALSLIVAFGGSALAQQPQTSREFWPAIDAHFELRDHFRLLGFAGLKRNEDLAYQQLNAGLGLGYQWKSISKPHPEDIDPDKEHTLVFGGGYEYLRTTSKKPQYE